MTAGPITKVGIPKWGLSMTEGRLVAWTIEEGTAVEQGDAVAEVETEKINGVVEAPAAGVFRRRVAAVGDVLPVGALIGVIAQPAVTDAEIEAFIADFQTTFVPGASDGEGEPQPAILDVGGRSVRYLKAGTGGEAVLLVHGFGGDLDNWLFNQAALAADSTVYGIDLPGHGGSSKDVGGGTLEEYARLLLEALSALGVERAHLVGHSMGGGVAMTCARLEPARVRSLVLIGSIGFGPEINAEFISAFVAANSRREVQQCLELLFTDPALVTRALVNDVLRYKRIDGVQQALATVAERLFPNGRQAAILAPALAASGIATLILWGREDRIVPAAHAAAAPAHARVEILEGVGHSPHVEAAGSVNRLIGAFLASVSGR